MTRRASGISDAGVRDTKLEIPHSSPKYTTGVYQREEHPSEFVAEVTSLTMEGRAVIKDRDSVKTPRRGVDGRGCEQAVRVWTRGRNLMLGDEIVGYVPRCDELKYCLRDSRQLSIVRARKDSLSYQLLLSFSLSFFLFISFYETTEGWQEPIGGTD